MVEPGVVLTVNGNDYGGWKSVRISLGMEQVAGTFDLSVSERWPGQPEAWPIMPGDECRVSIATDQKTVVITGYVDDVNISYDAGSHTIQVTGRDKTGDLVDCSAIHKTGQWSGSALEQIAADICRPFGIAAKRTANTGARFGKFALQEAETAWEALERAAKMRGVLMMSDGQGSLVITRAGTNRIGTALVKGENILAASGQFSHKDRYSKYIIKGQSPGTDFSSAEHNTATKATATDDALEKRKRYRPLIVIAEQGDGSTYADRAKWERNVRAGRASRVTYTVAGWTHAEGLWLPNNLVAVQDDLVGISRDLIIAAVTYSLEEGSGSRTELQLCRPEAFDLVSMPDKHKKKEKAAW